MRSLKFNFVAMSLAMLLFVFSLSVCASEIDEDSKVDALIKLRAINPKWEITNRKAFIEGYFSQIYNGEFEIVQLFRIAGLDANTVDSFLSTATMAAAGSGQQEIFDDFIKSADLKVMSKTGLTVSLAAARGGTRQIIKTLKKRQADFTATNAADTDHLMRQTKKIASSQIPKINMIDERLMGQSKKDFANSKIFFLSDCICASANKLVLGWRRRPLGGLGRVGDSG